MEGSEILMRRIWKELIIVLCFILIYALLLYEHEQHMLDIVVKEIPYIVILLQTFVVIFWISDKVNQYRHKKTLNDKINSLCNQYDLSVNHDTHTLKNYDKILDQMNQKLKNYELNLAQYEYRYRKIADITNQIIFEYDLVAQTICNSLNWRLLRNKEQFIHEFIEEKLVHPDDITIFRNFFEGPFITGSIHEITIRIRKKGERSYYYTNVNGVVLEGLNGIPEKIIGRRTTLHIADENVD